MIVIIVIAILGFMFWISEPQATTGVVLYFANIGTGKTTFLSKLAIQEQKKMAKGKSKYTHIISNAMISGVTYVPDFRDILKKSMVEKTLILVDEGSIVYNNRKMNLTELEIQNFKLIRHYQTDMIVLSQSYDDIDVTLRRLYTSIFLLTKLPYITLIRPIRKTVGIDEVSKQIIDEYSFKWIFSWRFFVRPIYFKYFNSWWIPSNVPICDLSKFEVQPSVEERPLLERLTKFYKVKDLNLLLDLKPKSSDLDLQPQSFDFDLQPRSVDLDSQPKSLEFDSKPYAVDLDLPTHAVDLDHIRHSIEKKNN